jgi:hypothetical protein
MSLITYDTPKAYNTYNETTISYSNTNHGPITTNPNNILYKIMFSNNGTIITKSIFPLKKLIST